MERTEIQALEVQAPPQAPETRLKKRKNGFWIWLWLILAGALAYGGYRYLQGSSSPSGQKAEGAQAGARTAPRAVSVAAVPARSGDIPVYLRGLGSVTPFNNVVVRPRVDGQLMAVHFREGQFVKQGQVLAEIDPRPFEVQLQQAQGQMARDVAQLNDAKANLARYETLWKQQIIPQQQRDTAAAAVGQIEGALQADQANINNARLQLTYARVTAPLSGRIGLRQVDAGNIVHASDANGLASIAQIQPISILFTIPADDLPPVLKKLRAGQKLRVDAYDRDDTTKIASGSVLTVDNQIDPTTGTVRIKAVFPNTDSSLFPSQFVNCRLLIEVRHNAIIVPAPAIQRGQQGTFVYTIEQGLAKVRPVEVGLTEGNDVAIDQGLHVGEMVIVDGQDKLQEGSNVQVRGGSPNGGRGEARGRQPNAPAEEGPASRPPGQTGMSTNANPNRPEAPRGQR